MKLNHVTTAAMDSAKATIDAGHTLMVERPDEVNRAIKNRLREKKPFPRGDQR